MYQRALVIIRC